MARDKKCPQCAEAVKSEAKVCRFCGYQFPADQIAKPSGGVGKGCLIVVAVLFVLGVVGSVFSPRTPGGNAPAPQATSTTDPGYKLASNTAMAAGLALKKSARNPDSLVIESALATKDGEILCLAYRAQNGFGGMNRTTVAYENGTPRTGRKFWTDHCRGEMSDVTAAAKLGAGL